MFPNEYKLFENCEFSQDKTTIIETAIAQRKKALLERHGLILDLGSNHAGVLVNTSLVSDRLTLDEDTLHSLIVFTDYRRFGFKLENYSSEIPEERIPRALRYFNNSNIIFTLEDNQPDFEVVDDFLLLFLLYLEAKRVLSSELIYFMDTIFTMQEHQLYFKIDNPARFNLLIVMAQHTLHVDNEIYKHSSRQRAIPAPCSALDACTSSEGIFLQQLRSSPLYQALNNSFYFFWLKRNLSPDLNLRGADLVQFLFNCPREIIIELQQYSNSIAQTKNVDFGLSSSDRIVLGNKFIFVKNLSLLALNLYYIIPQCSESQKSYRFLTGFDPADKSCGSMLFSLFKPKTTLEPRENYGAIRRIYEHIQIIRAKYTDTNTPRVHPR